MKMGKKLLLSGIIWLLTTSLTACVPSKPTREDIIGLWVEEQTTYTNKSPASCAYIEFFPDGRFEAYNIPIRRFILSGPPMRMNVSGSWELDTSSKDPFAVHRVELIFEPIQGYPLGFGSALGITIDKQALLTGPESSDISFVKRNAPGCK